MASNISWLWPPGYKGESWNPVTGCSHDSAGCEHCYAEELSRRYGWTKLPWTAQNAKENIKLRWDKLDVPLHWREPRCIFVNSMSDLFHKEVSDDFLHEAFRIMTTLTRHIFIIVTKRAERMYEYLSAPHEQWRDVLPKSPHIWLLVSTEDQANFNRRVPWLLKTPAYVRGISYEPAIGPIKPWWTDDRGDIIGALSGLRESPHWTDGPIVKTPTYAKLDWVLYGSESGNGRRPEMPEWAESMYKECRRFKIPFFFKQASSRFPGFVPERWKGVQGYPLILDSLGINSKRASV